MTELSSLYSILNVGRRLTTYIKGLFSTGLLPGKVMLIYGSYTGFEVNLKSFLG
jgi:hypothetical protein